MKLSATMIFKKAPESWDTFYLWIEVTCCQVFPDCSKLMRLRYVTVNAHVIRESDDADVQWQLVHSISQPPVHPCFAQAIVLSAQPKTTLLA